MRATLIISMLIAVAGCKTRDPDASGLLDDDSAATSEPDADAPAPGGDWTITCNPAEPDPDIKAYTLNVSGATTADEAQFVRVSLRLTHSEAAAGQDVVADRVIGHGAIAENGPVFVGFPSGVLTADAPTNGGLRAGVLTLVSGRNTAGLKVTCTAVKS
jgi:hypothetical protein